MTKFKLIELGWTEEKLRERVLRYWNYQKNYIKSNSNKSYRQINAGLYLRDKQFLQIFINN
jgi:hypothetical protein